MEPLFTSAIPGGNLWNKCLASRPSPWGETLWKGFSPQTPFPKLFVTVEGKYDKKSWRGEFEGGSLLQKVPPSRISYGNSNA